MLLPTIAVAVQDFVGATMAIHEIIGAQNLVFDKL